MKWKPTPLSCHPPNGSVACATARPFAAPRASGRAGAGDGHTFSRHVGFGHVTAKALAQHLTPVLGSGVLVNRCGEWLQDLRPKPQAPAHRDQIPWAEVTWDLPPAERKRLPQPLQRMAPTLQRHRHEVSRQLPDLVCSQRPAQQGSNSACGKDFLPGKRCARGLDRQPAFDLGENGTQMLRACITKKCRYN